MQLFSDSSTQGGSKLNKDGVVSWNNYQGSKESHDVEVTQMNMKDTDSGDHIYYNPKTGKEGAALGTERQKDW